MHIQTYHSFGQRTKFAKIVPVIMRIAALARDFRISFAGIVCRTGPSPERRERRGRSYSTGQYSTRWHGSQLDIAEIEGRKIARRPQRGNYKSLYSEYPRDSEARNSLISAHPRYESWRSQICQLVKSTMRSFSRIVVWLAS